MARIADLMAELENLGAMGNTPPPVVPKAEPVRRPPAPVEIEEEEPVVAVSEDDVVAAFSADYTLGDTDDAEDEVVPVREEVVAVEVAESTLSVEDMARRVRKALRSLEAAHKEFQGILELLEGNTDG
jgi:hypothetical protein